MVLFIPILFASLDPVYLSASRVLPELMFVRNSFGLLRHLLDLADFDGLKNRVCTSSMIWQ